jgi:O-phosphoseryl-tRNA(Sec) kinase
MNKFLLALCGLPASGKTTLAKAVQSKLGPRAKVQIVSTDEWRDQLYYSEFLPEKEHDVREAALERVTETLAQGFSVIHDDTNYYASMRHELREAARTQQYAFAVVFVSTPLETCLRWNRERKAALPEHVIVRIGSNFDRPGDRYAWDTPIAAVDLSEVGVDDAAMQVIRKLRALSPSVEQDSHPIETDDRSIDVATREAVSQFLGKFATYRSDPRVHQIRKRVLSESVAAGESPEQARKRLIAELEELIRTNSR